MSNSTATLLRQRGLDARRALGVADRRQRSLDIQRRFLRSRLFFSSRTIACYFSSPDEVDTSQIFERSWKANKKIFAPVVDDGSAMSFVEVRPDSDLKKNRYGLWEPISGAKISPNALHVVITPLVAFDVNANRIGMGGGHYDRAFAFLKARRLWLQPKLIGLAFECQKVEKIKANPWDIRLYTVFSESR